MNVTSFLSLPNSSTSSSSAVYSPFLFTRSQPHHYQSSFSQHHSLFSPGYRSRDHYFVKEITPTKILNDKINAELESGADVVATSTLQSNFPQDVHSAGLRPANNSTGGKTKRSALVTNKGPKKRRRTLLDE